MPAPLGASALVVGGTAWHIVAADVDPAWVADRVARDPITGPLGAPLLTALAEGVGAEPGVLDALLVAPAPPVAPGLDLVDVPPGEHPRVVRAEHPRVVRALAHRTGVRVWTTPDGTALLTLGRVAGAWSAPRSSSAPEPGALSRAKAPYFRAGKPAYFRARKRARFRAESAARQRMSAREAIASRA